MKAQLKQRLPAETYAKYERMEACHANGMEVRFGLTFIHLAVELTTTEPSFFHWSGRPGEHGWAGAGRACYVWRLVLSYQGRLHNGLHNGLHHRFDSSTCTPSQWTLDCERLAVLPYYNSGCRSHGQRGLGWRTTMD
jgi:hypothetical protein